MDVFTGTAIQISKFNFHLTLGSQDGHFSFVTDAGLRATFVSTATQIVEDYGFDGM